ncbi:uncharacterized protein Z518_03305 [Rhinocladiella mackenziei CBS 650.93]|uniref:DUF4604 domain-containing protein n=1 Tax=Rhinocladiella mackenziei CBS 650.93 TaxID=1442369 RepID=A0A0D2HDM6_9EURO|nr:uncharacterized protein Z518_03305 [Rhinocladiella mackenziei CBS 650.93]KIX08648.1 hypothetical protein Z518_03305 [Rhinocladiella mackenziei CBS 650.93]
MAFNARNIQYNQKEPSFLRKLRGEFGGLDGRHNVQIARPKKDRLKTGDGDEDDPVIVDEQGERVEKGEFERRIREGDLSGNQGGKEPGADPEADRNNGKQEKQKVVEIGASANAKKRKAGKVVGADDEDGDGKVGDTSEETAQRKNDDGEAFGSKKNEPGTGKKKGKKIKLSFDEPDG